MSIDDGQREALQFILGEMASLQREVNSLRAEVSELKRAQQPPLQPASLSHIDDVAEQSTSAHDAQLLDEDSMNRLRQLLQPQKPALKPTNDTVIELYEEYERGLNGNPSIKALENAFGNSWRSAPATNMAYSRRLVVIREIEKRARQYAHEDGKRDADLDDQYIYRVINELEDERRTSKLRMHAFIQQLKAKSDGGE